MQLLTLPVVHEIMHLVLDRIYEAVPGDGNPGLTIQEVHALARKGLEKFGEMKCFRQILETQDVAVASDLAHKASDLMLEQVVEMP